MKDKQALRLFSELWADLQQPDLLWQIGALVFCFLLAALLARWWQGRDTAQESRLHAAGVRVAMPFSALVLLLVATEALDGFVHTRLLAAAIPFMAALVLVRVAVDILRQSFSQAAWLVVTERWVAWIVWLGLALHLTGLASSAIVALERLSIPLGKSSINLWMVGKGSATVIVTLLLSLWVGGLIEARLMRAASLDSSLRIVSVWVTKALLILAALMIGLSLVGIDITAFSVFTGALGVGLGLGLQKIASNYVAGFIILLDRSIRLGNMVQIGAETSGTVTEITTRYTVLRNQNGVEFIVPNEVLVGSTVQNQSYSDNTVRVAVTVGVAYDTPDLEGVLKLMEDMALKHARVLPNPAPKALFLQFGDSAIQLELGFWVADPQEGVGVVRSDVAIAIWRAFADQGIGIPLPQRELRLSGEHWREGKKNPATLAG